MRFGAHFAVFVRFLKLPLDMAQLVSIMRSRLVVRNLHTNQAKQISNRKQIALVSGEIVWYDTATLMRVNIGRRDKTRKYRFTPMAKRVSWTDDECRFFISPTSPLTTE